MKWSSRFGSPSSLAWQAEAMLLGLNADSVPPSCFRDAGSSLWSSRVQRLSATCCQGKRKAVAPPVPKAPEPKRVRMDPGVRHGTSQDVGNYDDALGCCCSISETPKPLQYSALQLPCRFLLGCTFCQRCTLQERCHRTNHTFRAGKPTSRLGDYVVRTRQP